MAFIKYSKYEGGDWDKLSLEDLLNMLSDFLLQSGFRNSYFDPYDSPDHNQTLQELYDNLLEAILNQGRLPHELQDQLQGDGAIDAQAIEEIIQHIIGRLAGEGYITIHNSAHSQARNDPGSLGGHFDARPRAITFEITEKTIDFLGYKTLKDLLGSLGKSSFGHHDTKDFATSVESCGVSKPYDFGDTLNLDISATLLKAIQREGTGLPINIDYPDLMVYQSEYKSSCATALLLDCSHSMILYGEDRFTPAKKVALALSHLIKTQYPGDSLHAILFHDSAEEVPLSQLARVKVGPYYTNTCEGLRLAQRILQRQRKDMKQIIMITDGKPSAITQADGRIYKNAFGLDPLIISQTFKEVAKCRKSGILINTFMLARDYELVNFVKRVTEISKGKAYFTTPYTLGQYILMDYMEKKMRRVH